MDRTYKKTKHICIGGIRCPCCTPFSKGKDNKQFLNRDERRKKKINTNKEAGDVDYYLDMSDDLEWSPWPDDLEENW